MVELTHNGERYMVDGGQWYRRLKVGEMVSYHTELRSEGSELWHKCHLLVGGVVFNGDEDDYRIPCTDPRLPFVVGQRVKVARLDPKAWTYYAGDRQYLGMECEITEVYKDGSGYRTSLDGWSFNPWCLDAVSEQKEQAQ